MEENINQITTEFRKKLLNIESVYHDPLIEADRGITLCRKTLGKLKQSILAKDFSDMAAEIHFFKEIKTLPLSYLLYYEKVHSCESGMPQAGHKRKKKFLDTHMEQIDSFLKVNTIFVNYLRLQRTDMDDRYFTRGFLTSDVAIQIYGTVYDSDFDTMHDHLLADVRAMYRYMEYINRALREMRTHAFDGIMDPSTPLEFIGNKIDLVELIYALHAAKVFKGNPDIIVIQRAVERLFNVKLGYIYTRFQQIQDRSGEQLKFLPRLVSVFARLLDKRDELKLE